MEVILCQSFGECISNLVFCVDREYLDKPLAYMFAKMMVAYIDMLCPMVKFRKSCEFQSTQVIFKDFAVYVGFSTNDFEAFLANLLNKIHDWNDITKSL